MHQNNNDVAVILVNAHCENWKEAKQNYWKRALLGHNTCDIIKSKLYDEQSEGDYTRKSNDNEGG